MIALLVMAALLLAAVIGGAVYSRRHQADADDARRQLSAAEQQELQTGIAATAMGGYAAGGLLVAKALDRLSDRQQQRHARRTAAHWPAGRRLARPWRR